MLIARLALKRHGVNKLPSKYLHFNTKSPSIVCGLVQTARRGGRRTILMLSLTFSVGPTVGPNAIETHSGFLVGELFNLLTATLLLNGPFSTPMHAVITIVWAKRVTSARQSDYLCVRATQPKGSSTNTRTLALTEDPLRVICNTFRKNRNRDLEYARRPYGLMTMCSIRWDCKTCLDTVTHKRQISPWSIGVDQVPTLSTLGYTCSRFLQTPSFRADQSSMSPRYLEVETRFANFEAPWLCVSFRKLQGFDSVLFARLFG